MNVTALFAEAASKSGLLWIELPDDRAWAVWHVWTGDAVLVVAGPGEQNLPWLPETVRLVLRSKDTGGRLLVVSGAVAVLEAGTPRWEQAADALKGARLNAIDDLLERWARECTLYAITPFGSPLEGPGTYAVESRRVSVAPGTAATASWRPWHAGGRPQRRRRAR